MTQPTALGHLRICDFTGQLAGAGATRWLAAFGAEVIRVEDPVNQGRWDILRGTRPHVGEARGVEAGGGFNNHNVGKLGVTLNLRTDRGKELLAELIAVSDVVTENFAAGVLDRWGFPYERIRELRDDIIYVSNCGFGHRGPYAPYRTWGPIVQAMSGLTFSSGLPDLPPAGWGFSYMDHHGGNFMVFAILAALIHRQRTGEGQWVDIACLESAASMLGPAVLDFTVNGVPTRRPGSPSSNRSQSPRMAPHGIYPCVGDDRWVAIACRDDGDWKALRELVGEPVEGSLASLDERLAHEDALDAFVGRWTSVREDREVAAQLQALGIPAAPVQHPADRIDHDPNTLEWGLWPAVEHPVLGRVRVDGVPVHLSETDWVIDRAAPTLGQHNDDVYTRVLGLSAADVDELRGEGII